VAVLETARGGILREGLAFDECKVGVVTNVASDHLGMGGIDTLDDLARVKQVVIEAVGRDGAAVLNAEDPLVAEMAAETNADVIYFSRNSNNHVMRAHLAEGGRGVFVEDEMIILATGEDQHVDLVEMARIPFTFGGRIPFQVMNALAATAAAWGAGLSPAMIARALTTFETSPQAVPGRFNTFNFNGVEVILDYGHNPAALKALGEAIAALPERRTVMSFTLPGDRRDEDLIESTRATLTYVDAYVIYDSEDRRGRNVNEVAELMCQQLPPDVSCSTARGQHEGIHLAWSQVKPGERLIVICDEIDESLAILHSLAKSIDDDWACVNPLIAEPVNE
jgi:cyanophycin synthetase